MLDDLLPGQVAPELERTIVERSEGNPLYVEEIVRKLIDDGVLRATEVRRWEVARPVEDVELPRSIQGLIAARLDGLPEDEKAVLQDAAVVGRVFWVGAVAELTGRTRAARSRDALGRLRVKELVAATRALVVLRRARVLVPPQPDPRRRVRLAAEGAPRRQARRRRAVGRAARRRPRRRDRRADRDPPARGPRLPRRARRGGRATRRARARARSRWTSPAGQRTVGRLAAGRGDAMVPRGRTPGRRARPRCRRSSSALVRAHVDASWGTDPTTETERVTRGALRVYEALGDPVGVGWARSHRVLPLLQLARDDEAERAGRTAVATLEPLGERGRARRRAPPARVVPVAPRPDRGGRAPASSRRRDGANASTPPHVHAESTQTLAVCLAQLGRSAEALETIEEAYRLAKEVGEFSNLMRCYNNLPSLVADLGSDLPRGRERCCARGSSSPSERGPRAHDGVAHRAASATACSELGRLEEAEGLQRRGVELADRRWATSRSAGCG